jgi:hypothetical protein
LRAAACKCKRNQTRYADPRDRIDCGPSLAFHIDADRRSKSESEFEAAFEAARKARAEAMLVMISPTYVGKRGELVFQQPTRFELDVNLKAAREIGLEVPQSTLMRTSRVIE